MQSSEPTQKQQCNLESASMVEMVIGELGRVDLFDAASLKALRLTCRAFRDLVDSTGIFSSYKFKLYDDYSREGLEQWAGNAGWVQRTRSLAIADDLPPALAQRIIAAITDHTPPISKLELDGVGEDGEALLSLPLELRELSLESFYENSGVLSKLATTPSFEGLRSLCLDTVDVDLATLAAALARFPDLRSLCLCFLDIQGNNVVPNTLQNALARLECYESVANYGVWYGMKGLGLLGAQGPALPALRKLHLMSDDTTLIERPWLAQLTYLSLDENHVDSPAVGAALNGGPLQVLSLLMSIYDEENPGWDWKSLEFPHLIRIELASVPGSPGVCDILSHVARAKMPALRSVKLGFSDCSSVAGSRAFIAAFPHIRELCLWGIEADEEEGVLEVFFSHLVPNLETLAFDFERSCGLPSISAIMQHFLPSEPATGSARWPRMRALELGIPYNQKYNQFCDDFIEKSGFFPALVSAASHFPALTSLRMKADPWRAPGYTEKAREVFAAAAEESGAWKLLEALRRGTEEDCIFL